MRQTFNRLAVIGVLSLSLAACASRQSVDNGEPQTFPYVRLAPSAPPTPPYEELQRAEQPMTHVWRAGYWDYDGKEFIWIPGHLLLRPDPTAAWIQDRWEQRTFGWAFIPGYWQ